MDAEQVVVESAHAAACTVGTKSFGKTTSAAINLMGAALGKHLNQSDTPGLFVPVVIEQDSKNRFGAILTLADRSIIAWTVGTFRMKNFEVVIPINSIASIEQSTRPGGPMTYECEVLKITAKQRSWIAVFDTAAFEGGRTIVPFVKGMLEGAMRPVFEGE